MPADLLVKLYELEDDWSFMQEHAARGITIRRPIGPEKHWILEWVGKHFSPIWASETDVALSNQPLTIFIAVKERKLVGFVCYDATARGFVGPFGVSEDQRRVGLGASLFMACLLDMKHAGYGYAILGMADEKMFDYYGKRYGAVPIEGSGQSLWKTWVMPEK